MALDDEINFNEARYTHQQIISGAAISAGYRRIVIDEADQTIKYYSGPHEARTQDWLSVSIEHAEPRDNLVIFHNGGRAMSAVAKISARLHKLYTVKKHFVPPEDKV